MFEFVDICNHFLRFDIRLLWATDRDIDLNSSTGQWIAGAKAWGAGEERKAIMRRFRLRRQHHIASGRLDHASIPYGYRWADAERQAELRTGYMAKLEAAEAEHARRQAQDARVQAFAEWAASTSPDLPTFTTDQRRELLVQSLHPTVFVARVDSTKPRLWLVFSVTPEAAALLDPRTLYTTGSWQGAHGEYYAVSIDDFSEPTSRTKTTLDLTNVEATDTDISTKE